MQRKELGCGCGPQFELTVWVAVFDGENLSMSVFNWLYPTPEVQATVPKACLTWCNKGMQEKQNKATECLCSHAYRR